ncbi:MAG: peptidyl-prolyl cis-trans isomerase [Saprospiraceae bacterium]|nr:peptidyl-prolyl cis-trans isomerase [Saprospiraceae bacterium]
MSKDKMRNDRWMIFLIGSILIVSCKNQNSLSSDDKVIARACNKELKFSEVKNLLYINGTDLKDSVKLLYSLAENWASEACFIEQAKKIIGEPQRIDELVDNYRNSLYLDEYEKKLKREKTDSSITEEEFRKYYQEKRGEYKLDGPILKLMYVKINKKQLDEKIFLPLWNLTGKDQIQVLQKYCSDFAEEHIINGDKWQKWNEINDIIPQKIIDINKLSKGLQQRYENKDHYYFIKVFDIVRPNQEPPLSFVKEQATRSILHMKKMDILESNKKAIYDKALSSKQIYIYVK